MNARQVVRLKKGTLKMKRISISGPITLKMLSLMRLDHPRSLNLCLDLKLLDGKGVITVIKHTNKHECQVGSTIEKRDLENEKKIFISSPITLKMLSQVRLGPRSSNLCLDLKQLNGKWVKKLFKHTKGDEMLGRQ